MEKSNKCIFLNHTLSEETPGYGGSQGFSLENVKSRSCGDTCNQINFTMTNHIGTHIDAPKHFFDEGHSLTDYPAKFWIMEQVSVVNLELSPGTLIAPDHVEERIAEGTEFLIINTSFWKKRNEEVYWKNNPGLSKELGQYLREKYPKLKAIGGDFISATSYSNRPEGKLAHQAFLDPQTKGNPILIVEDMKLDDLDFNPASVIISPLAINNADGAPVTILAFEG